MTLRTVRPPRRGMTLIELLVAIAIISLVAALALPAINAAREAARRARCSSNLRQVGLAIGGYQSSFRRLPYGCLERRSQSNPTGRQLAWSAAILPHIDAAVADHLDMRLAYDHPANAEAAATVVDVYICPSVVRTAQVRGPTDYGGLYGQRLTTKKNTNNGVFVYDLSFRPADVKDGLVNTMAVGEDYAGPDSEWINGSNVLEVAFKLNEPRYLMDNELRSLHPGGVMTLFCDGSDRFLSESIDRPTLAAFITRAGGDAINAR